MNIFDYYHLTSQEYIPLYDLTEEDLCYLIDLKDVLGHDLSGKTFRVLKEIKQSDEHRTKCVISEEIRKILVILYNHKEINNMSRG